MPFDVGGFVAPTSLNEYLKQIGITPVPMAQLQAHKQAQLRLHPASLFATRKPYLAAGLIGFVGFLALYALVGTGGTSYYGIAMTALMVGGCSAFTCFMLAN